MICSTALRLEGQAPDAHKSRLFGLHGLVGARAAATPPMSHGCARVGVAEEGSATILSVVAKAVFSLTLHRKRDAGGDYWMNQRASKSLPWVFAVQCVSARCRT